MLLERNPGVLYQPVTEGAILMDPRQEVYYGLNVVGAQVWELLPNSFADLTPIVEEMAGRYPDVEQSVLRADITELVRDLQSNGLLQIRSTE
jgi:coenzyme PQQ synthesis protein D (PqqD)